MFQLHYWGLVLGTVFQERYELIRGQENITKRRRLKEVSHFREEMSEMSL